MTSPAEAERLSVRIEGIVQGVGFRPFVYHLAHRFQIVGHVGNDSQGVFLEIEGPPASLREMLAALQSEAPPLARIEEVRTTRLEPRHDTAFLIAPSDRGSARETLVSPDVATCDDCLREILDPRERRYRYAFTNCTNCGPRYTIVRDVPYDRASTTMASFPMCGDCRREYDDPADRRFHAQPIACAACGPRLHLWTSAFETADADAIEATVRLLVSGAIVAIKGLGGYHLATDAANESANARLRARKHREDKPFALMVADLDAARQLAHLNGDEETLLRDPARPIVLVARRQTSLVAAAVAPDNDFLGIMLPYTPLHHLLLRAHGRPIVLTSGNLSDEPIAFGDNDARARLGGIADAFLTHDREIHVRTDDSVMRVVAGNPLPLRRSRGYVPAPLRLPIAAPAPILACGGELKSTICLVRGHHAFLSHHIGDLENYTAWQSYPAAVEHLQKLFSVTPQLIAHDLHPEYLSTKWALDQDGVQHLGVQHHHAHIAACLADNAVTRRVIGVAFDGLGYGTDATLWGGEILLADLSGFERLGHLTVVGMPGATAAIREPWRMALAWLLAAYDGSPPRGLEVMTRNAARWDIMTQVAVSPALSPRSSSMGRLFDAVAALIGLRDEVTFEGQAAIALEQVVDTSEPGTYPFPLRDYGAAFELDARPLIRAIVEDAARDVPPPIISARFHQAVTDGVLDACRQARERSGLHEVALSGGVFQNRRLLERCIAGLENERFNVLRHRRVPPNDGGISLGQAVIAASRG